MTIGINTSPMAGLVKGAKVTAPASSRTASTGVKQDERSRHNNHGMEVAVRRRPARSGTPGVTGAVRAGWLQLPADDDEG